MRLALTSCLCVACRERILSDFAAEVGRPSRPSRSLHERSVWAFDMGGLKHHFTPCTEEKYINLPQFLIRSMFCLRNRIIKSTSSFCVELTYRTTAKVRIADVPRKLRTTQRPRLSAWFSRRALQYSFMKERWVPCVQWRRVGSYKYIGRASFDRHDLPTMDNGQTTLLLQSPHLV